VGSARVSIRKAIRAELIKRPRGRQLVEIKGVGNVLWSIRPGQEWWPGMTEPFNGQRARLDAVRSIIRSFDPDAFVETGTFIGSTTRFFCGNGVPVYTAEAKLSFWLIARLRLGWGSGANVFHGDSKAMLSNLAAERPFQRPLAYLDAHWWSEMPVESELNLIFDAFPEAVVVIDDFQVEDDPGYAYDQYDGLALSLRHIPIPSRAVVAYPAVGSEDETGARRGTLYVAKGPDAMQTLETLVDQGILRLADSKMEAAA
jgi:hypothetical protein